METSRRAPADPTPEAEHQYHDYRGNAVPWFVHVLWILFWCFAISYAIRFFIPTMQMEMLSPP